MSARRAARAAPRAARPQGGRRRSCSSRPRRAASSAKRSQPYASRSDEYVIGISGSSARARACARGTSRHARVRIPRCSARSPARRITGPSASGSENGKPSSMMSAPPSAAALRELRRLRLRHQVDDERLLIGRHGARTGRDRTRSARARRGRTTRSSVRSVGPGEAARDATISVHQRDMSRRRTAEVTCGRGRGLHDSPASAPRRAWSTGRSHRSPTRRLTAEAAPRDAERARRARRTRARA